MRSQIMTHEERMAGMADFNAAELHRSAASNAHRDAIEAIYDQIETSTADWRLLDILVDLMDAAAIASHEAESRRHRIALKFGELE